MTQPPNIPQLIPNQSGRAFVRAVLGCGKARADVASIDSGATLNREQAGRSHDMDSTTAPKGAT